MRFHVLGVPHTSTDEAHQWCAFTKDVTDFCTLMSLRGHTVYLYAGPHNEARVTEHVACISAPQQEKWFGAGYADRLTPDNLFDETQAWWTRFNTNTVRAIKSRIEPGDIICTIVGKAHQQVVDAFPDNLSVEWMVGFPADRRYTRFANYVSYAWRNHCEGRAGMCFLNWADSVIPNPFVDPGDTTRQNQGYLLFVGRMNQSKGLHIANDIALRTGRQLVVAGAGDESLAPNARHLGIVTGAVKQRLMANAHALLVPSIYAEPFGKVVVEAQILGVPTITSDFGAFPETVIQGFNGNRCKTMGEFVAAVDTAYASPQQIAQHARETYCYNPETGDGNPGERLESWFTRLVNDWYPKEQGNG